jgi:hypothetical protein
MAATQQALLMIGGASGATDPDYASVVLLMHMDGANGGTSFVDEKGHTCTAVGSATTSTIQQKWGSASAKFGSLPSAITVASSSGDMVFGSGIDYTIEMWVYPTSFSDYQSIFSTGDYNTTQLTLRINPSGYVEAFYGSGGSILTTSNALTANAWHHIAVCRSSGGAVTGIYVDGVRDALWSLSFDASANSPRIGSILVSGTEFFPSLSYIDDLRVTKAVARYTGSSYTVPTAAFPNS